MVFSLLVPITALAAPRGGQVARGQAAIRQSELTTNIDQSTPKAVINWQGFSIGAKETVNFNQPSSKAMTLNRVVGNEKSLIEGALNANGKVFLLNSQGVLISQGASVNVGSLVASTLDIKDENFIKGDYAFEGSGSGQVINYGKIKAADGGYVALLGPKAINEGVIVAEKGTVSLNGAKKVTLNFNGDSLVGVSLDEGAIDALVASKNAIYADGGQIILTAKAANDLTAAQVNTAGILRAQTLADLTGKIEVFAHGGTANIDGTLDASAPQNGHGGFIETSGDKVKIAETADVTTKAANGKTGTWLIDPQDYIVDLLGDQRGKQLSDSLEKNNISIESAKGKTAGHGDIYINDAIAWKADTTLTLIAENDIYINSPITATGTNAGLVLGFTGDYYILTPASFSGTVLDPVTDDYVAKIDDAHGVYGSLTLTGANAKLKINADDYILLRDLSQLQAINENTQGKYALAQDLDLSASPLTTSVIEVFPENSVLAGLGHVIKNLTIDASKDYVQGSFAYNSYSYVTVADSGLGFIGTANQGSSFRDLGLTNVTIRNNVVDDSSVGPSPTGGFIGLARAIDLVSNVYVTGKVEAKKNVNYGLGGLIGVLAGKVLQENGSLINYVFSKVDIYAESKPNYSIGTIGGLIGSTEGLIGINQTHHIGNITINGNTSTPGNGTGGLIGYIYNRIKSDSYVTNSYNIGNINANNEANLMFVGGLIGQIYYLKKDETQLFTLTNSFASGNIEGYSAVGGLVGSMNSLHGMSFIIDKVYAKGQITVSSNQSSLPGTNMYRGFGGLFGNINLALQTGSTSVRSIITRSYSDVSIANYDTIPSSYVYSFFYGGIVGVSNGVNIYNSYSNYGDVTGTTSMNYGIIENTYGNIDNARFKNSFFNPVGEKVSGEYLADSAARAAILRGEDPTEAYAAHQIELQNEATRLENERLEQENIRIEQARVAAEALATAEAEAQEAAFQKETVAVLDTAVDGQKSAFAHMESISPVTLANLEMKPVALEGSLGALSGISDSLAAAAYSAGVGSVTSDGATYVIDADLGSRSSTDAIFTPNSSPIQTNDAEGAANQSEEDDNEKN
ncbi:MAG: filamentous hemagglutinin N-terminal domain-containing protein [Deltaproteobacteria bacterium]|nr:filamentous hemagglutinin N-terminal domain-containing protein [Deltaproteobacteria bacterium]